MSVPAAQRQAGFTLLEVLIAVVVLGFLVIGLTQGVRAGLSLRQAQSRHVDRIADLDATMRILRELLTRLPLVPEGTRLLASAAGTPFKGEANQVSFVGRMPTGLGTTSLADLTLAVIDRQLTISWLPHRHEYVTASQHQRVETELLPQVDRLELAYWVSPVPGQPAAWQSRWEGVQAPELVRVRIVFPKGDARRWPDLIVAPRLW